MHSFNTKLISTRQILHRGSTQGTVITEIQTVEIDGQRFEIPIWRDWQSQRFVRAGEPRAIAE